MLAAKLICPHCSRHLKTSKPLTPGHRVLCSRCGRSFPVPADAAPAAPCEAVQKPPADPLPPPALNATHIQNAPANLPAPLPPPRNQRMWIGLVLGGLLLLVGTSVGLALYLAERTGVPPADGQANLESSPDDELARADASPDSSPARPDYSPDAPLPPPPSAPRREGQPAPANEPPPLSSPEAQRESAAWLPPEVQTKVNKAIDEGVHFLETIQKRGGIWGPRSGLTALPGLTLLECGVPATDPHVQKAAQHIREAIPRLIQTYDLALSILFLERLGDPRDRKLIQTCALRLVAGQSPAGGWTYTCRVLSSDEERDLLTVLQNTRPTSGLDLFVQGPNGSAPPGFIAQGPGTSPSGSIQQEESVESKLATPGGAVAPLGDPGKKAPPDPAAAKKALDRLPAHLRNLASLRPVKEAHSLPARDATDNSNTQFAILGLWAASRQGLPLERPLALVTQRFRKTASRPGGWGYRYVLPTPANQVTPSMTGAGLLGLAVGLGLAADHSSRPAQGGRIEDPTVEKGFEALSQAIGKPLGWKRPRAKNRTQINLYLLWTTERVGVLFNRRAIGGKDWYSWGTELLLDHQHGDGSWFAKGYPGSAPVTDTCFALLFLKRANLAKDLTQKLEFFMEGKGLRDR